MSDSLCLRLSSWALHFTLGIGKGEPGFIKCMSPGSRLPGDKQHAASALAYTASRRAIKARWRLNYINFITGRSDPEWLTRQGGWSDELQCNYGQSTEKMNEASHTCVMSQISSHAVVTIVSPFCLSSCGRRWHNWPHYCIRHTRAAASSWVFPV